MDYGVSQNIVVNNVTVRDVNGSLVKEKGGGCGIYIVTGGAKKISTFNRLTTVSYTHLDVYKRQVIILKRNCIILTRGLTLVIRRMSYFRMKPGIFGSVPGLSLIHI